jgi:hypothetical protein
VIKQAKVQASRIVGGIGGPNRKKKKKTEDQKINLGCVEIISDCLHGEPPFPLK